MVFPDDWHDQEKTSCFAEEAAPANSAQVLPGFLPRSTRLSSLTTLHPFALPESFSAARHLLASGLFRCPAFFFAKHCAASLPPQVAWCSVVAGSFLQRCLSTLS